MRATVRERLYARLILCPDEGCACLLWTGSVSSQGYGRIKVDGKARKVHRVAWELDRGLIPEGLDLDHVKARGCRHKNCALLAHLEPVTRRENLLRGNTIPARHAAKTHCPQGHLYDDTWKRHNGSRRCAECGRQRHHEWYHHRRIKVAS